MFEDVPINKNKECLYFHCTYNVICINTTSTIAIKYQSFFSIIYYLPIYILYF